MKKFYMEFERRHGGQEEAVDEHQIRLNKLAQEFWKRMAGMITGPDHEYVYLKRLIKRINDKNSKKEAKQLRSYRLNEKHCHRIKKKLLSSKGAALAFQRKDSKVLQSSRNNNN